MTNPIAFLVGELERVREVRSMVRERMADDQRRLVGLDMTILGLREAIRRLGGRHVLAAHPAADPATGDHNQSGIG